MFICNFIWFNLIRFKITLATITQTQIYESVAYVRRKMIMYVKKKTIDDNEINENPHTTTKTSKF